MNSIIPSRLEALRQAMRAKNIQAYLIVSNDGHLGEYTPQHWKSRAWISGFNGSAGSIVVTQDKAGLWTDSRYFLQATSQLENSTIELYKEGVSGVPGIEEFLTRELPQGSILGCDGSCVSQAEVERMSKELSAFGITIDSSHDLMEGIWLDRPEIPQNEFRIHPTEYSGEATQARIHRILENLKKKGANATILTTLDELAWAFNIRNCDVDCNPVGVGFGFIGEKESVLFTFDKKVNTSLRTELQAQGVRIMGYQDIFGYLSALTDQVVVYVDKARISGAVYNAIAPHCRQIEGVSVVTMLKSYKNATELEGVHRSMHRDGVALTRFFMWLEDALKRGETPTEVDIDRILAEYRAQSDMYIGDSFDTICGYQDHGAIVHYRATPESAHTLRNEGVLLLDSGAQYKDGTTDITRTIALGDAEPEADLKVDYTLVLKGHIAIATAQFPEGTRGNQLDILARKALWDRALSYGHGTGHGVGVALNVHEGPQNIRTDNNPTPMAVGTFTSNEPGLYRAGKWGIRIENLIVTCEKCRSEFGTFLGFETVTLCYLDNRLVEKSLLTAEEIDWYNAYQEHVYQEISPLLTAKEAAWLRNKTQKL